MSIYNSGSTQYLQIICKPCDYNGYYLAEVEGLNCPRCGQTPTHICYADSDSKRDGL